jgi:hypothetical protein
VGSPPIRRVSPSFGHGDGQCFGEAHPARSNGDAEALFVDVITIDECFEPLEARRHDPNESVG